MPPRLPVKGKNSFSVERRTLIINQNTSILYLNRILHKKLYHTLYQDLRSRHKEIFQDISYFIRVIGIGKGSVVIAYDSKCAYKQTLNT